MGSKMYTNVHSIMSPSEHCICVLDCLTCYLLYFMSWKKTGRGGWKSKCKLGIKYQIHCFALITQWSESGNRDVLCWRSSSWYTDKHWGSTLYLCTSTSWPGPGYSVKNRGFKLIKQCWWVCWAWCVCSLRWWVTLTRCVCWAWAWTQPFYASICAQPLAFLLCNLIFILSSTAFVVSFWLSFFCWTFFSARHWH